MPRAMLQAWSDAMPRAMHVRTYGRTDVRGWLRRDTKVSLRNAHTHTRRSMRSHSDSPRLLAVEPGYPQAKLTEGTTRG